MILVRNLRALISYDITDFEGTPLFQVLNTLCLSTIILVRVSK